MIRQNDFPIVKAVDEVEIYALQRTGVVDADFLADLAEDRFVGQAQPAGDRDPGVVGVTGDDERPRNPRRAVLRAGRWGIIPQPCGIILHNFAYL